MRYVVFVVLRLLREGNFLDVYKNLREGERGAWVSIFTYIFLSALKLIVGLVGTSEALKADGLNNTTDIIASVAVLVGLRISQRPPDKDHHYGHLRAETVSSLIASFIMAVVGLQVVFSAIKKFIVGEHQAPSLLTAIVAVFCGVVMYIVYMYNIRLATRIKSSAVKAAAYDNRSDALVSFGTAVGILGAIFGFPMIDSITAIIVGIIIMKTAYDIFVEAVHTLTDGFDEEELAEIQAVVRNVKGVIDVRDIKGRMSGNMMFLDVTITVNPMMDVVQSHHITEIIESTVREYNPYAVTLVHIEPAEYATI